MPPSLIWFEVIPFRPFVPGINKNQLFFPDIPGLYPAYIRPEPFSVDCGIAVDENGSPNLSPRCVIPTWHNGREDFVRSIG
jgi:hypothetical protein